MLFFKLSIRGEECRILRFEVEVVTKLFHCRPLLHLMQSPKARTYDITYDITYCIVHIMMLLVPTTGC